MMRAVREIIVALAVYGGSFAWGVALATRYLPPVPPVAPPPCMLQPEPPLNARYLQMVRLSAPTRWQPSDTCMALT